MKFKWDSRYFLLGLTAFLVVICSMFFNWLLQNWTGLRELLSTVLKALSPVIIGLFIALLLDKPVQIFEKYLFIPMFSRGDVVNSKGSSHTRAMAIITAQLITWSLIIGLITLVLPQIYRSVVGIVSNADTYATNAVNWAERLLKNNPEIEGYAITVINSVSQFLTNWLQTSLLPQLNTIISSITEGVFIFIRGLLNVLIGIVISVYLMANKEVFLAQGKKLLYSIFKVKTANSIMGLFSEIHISFGGFFSGKIIDSLIIGILSYITLTILKMPYCALISLIIGVTNIIPVFGPFIGAIPSALIVLFESPFQCLIFIIFVIVLQQFDGNILGPKILGNSIGLSGFWIMFSILLFGELFGFMGMLLGVPIMAVIYGIIKRVSQQSLSEKGMPSETADFMKIDHIDSETKQPVYKDHE